MAIDLLNTDADESWLHDLFDEATNDDWAGFGDTVQQKYTHLFQKYNHNHDELGRFTSGDSSSLTLSDDPTDSQTSFAIMNYGAMAAKLPAVGDYRPIADQLIAAGGGDAGHVGAFLNDWKVSAHLASSTAVSEAARQQFNLPQTENGKRYLVAGEAAMQGAGIVLDPGPKWGEPIGSITTWPAAMDAASHFVKAQYQVTQQAFAALGYKPTDTIDLYRGVRDPHEVVENDTWHDKSIVSRGATSWSVSAQTALDFVGNAGYVIHCRIPVKDVLSTGFTGLGSSSEYEMVALGGPRRGRAISVTLEKFRPDAYYKALTQKYNHEHDQLGRFAATSEEVAGDPAFKAVVAVPVTPAPVPEGSGETVAGYPSSEGQRCAAYVKAALAKIAGMDGFTSGDQASNPQDGIIREVLPDPRVTGDPRGLEGHISGTDAIPDAATGDQALMTANEAPLVKDSGIDRDEVWDYLGNWDSYGADGGRTIFMSRAASDAIGVPLTPRQEGVLTRFLHGNYGFFDQGSALFRASYSETQAYYRDHPELTDDGQGKTVTLYRGINYQHIPQELAHVTSGSSKEIEIGAKPLTSWTADPSMAEEFARDKWGTHGPGYSPNAGYVMAARVPVERLVGNGIVGFGRPSQSEHIVLGGAMKVTVKGIEVN